MKSRLRLAWIAGLGITAAGTLALAAPALAGSAFGAPPLPAATLAQNDQTFSGVRALNLARNHAVKLNGGLGIYRPAACMFSTEWSGSKCLVRRDDAGFLFRFPGGPPGWQQLNLPPTLETEILIAPDGRSVVQLLHNGPPRQAPRPARDDLPNRILPPAAPPSPAGVPPPAGS